MWKRDGGRCTFTSDAGHRCEATRALEFDHIILRARGGESTEKNLRLLCRAHNQHVANQALGKRFMDGRREGAKERRADVRRKRERGNGGAPQPELAPHTDGAGAAAEPGAALVATRDAEVLQALRSLGFRPDEARLALARCAGMSAAPLEAHVKLALRQLAPASARTMPFVRGATA